MSRLTLRIISMCLGSFVALAFSFFAAAPIYAQVAGATLTGVVTDASGAVISGAKLSLKNVETGIIAEAISNSDGLYAVSNLLPGAYEMTVSAPGFARQVRSGLTLTVGAQVELNITLNVGQAAEQVQVTADTPAIQLATSTIDAVVNSKTVRELPLDGRDWTTLATLQAGVASLVSIQDAITTSAARPLRGFGNEATISGTRSTQTNYRIDGISIADYSNSGPGSTTGFALGVDAIQEFSVLTGSADAEYGRTGGSAINAITRSGTNEFHGSGFEFLRNSSLDAANFFDNAQGVEKPPLRRNQFGGTVGGPIQKERTFFFVNYEGFRQIIGQTLTGTTFSESAHNGIVYLPGGGTTTVDPLVMPFLALWPNPNQPVPADSNTGQYSFASNQTYTDNFVDARLDHKFSEKDSFSASYQYENGSFSAPGEFNNESTGFATSRQLITLQDTHVFSSQLANTVRVGFSRPVTTSLPITPINPAFGELDTPGLFSIEGKGVPNISISGVTAPGNSTVGGHPVKFFWNSFQGYDDAILSKGMHTIKFGAGAERDQWNEFQIDRAAGQFTFGSAIGFLTNQPGSFIYSEANTSTRGYRQSIFGAYVQDDVHFRPNLTVNLGLRYEMSTSITEIDGKLSSLANPADASPHLGSPLFANPTFGNFAPRVGFAWDPFRDGKTSVRGAFGIYDVLPLIYEMGNFSPLVAPFTFYGEAPSPVSAGAFPTGAYEAALAAPSIVRQAYVEPKPHRDYVMQWNLNVQRELMPNLTMMVAYVGDHGVHQPFRVDDMNDVMPALTAIGYMWPTVVGSQPVLNPNAGRIDSLQWSESDVYDALQVQITKRFSHGFQAQGSYTFGKALDEGSGSVVGDAYTNGISSPFWFDPSGRRALADFNIGQIFTANFIWSIPTPKSLEGPAAWVVRGWQTGGILQMNTGQPFTPFIGGDPLGLDNSDPFAYPDVLSGPGCSTRTNPGNPNNYIKTQCFALPSLGNRTSAPGPGGPACRPFSIVPGTCANLLGTAARNSLVGPGLVNFDFSLVKNTYIPRISEAFNVQFRAEFFNLFNRANFLPPLDNDTIFDQTGARISNAGVIDATSTTAREIQFAIKVIF
jgi:hypothetical protein